MKKKLLTLCCTILLCVFTQTVLAEQGNFGLTAKAGTLGVGLEATVGLMKDINARFGFNYFSFDDSGNESDVEYDFDVDLKTASLLFDWHFYGGGFRVSAGALYNGNEASATGRPSGGTYSINDTVYTAAQVGSLSGDVDFNSFAPYIGIGYGNAIGKDKRWHFAFDLGVMYQGDPDVSLSANGTMASDVTFQSNLESEARQAEDALDDYPFYPVIFIGVSYRF